MALPRYVVLQSAYTHKNVVYYNEEGEHNGFLPCTGEEVVSPLAKLEIERSTTTRGYVHLRCCYNNKYWARSTKDDIWIAARANEREDDQSRWNCTLFKLKLIEDDDEHTESLRIIHAQTGWYVSLNQGIENPRYPLYCRQIDHVDEFFRDVYKIIDWESLLILPKFVAFKGSNGSYLSVTSRHYLEFSTDDASSPGALSQVFTNNDGSIRIKNLEQGKFWRNGVNWIKVDVDEDAAKDDKDCWFWPFKVTDSVVALRSLRNNMFCSSLSVDGKTNTLNAHVSTINKDARMEVTEQVLRRTIYNVDFRLKDARIYDEVIKSVVSTVAKNHSSQANTIAVRFKHSETTTKEWSASVSLKLGIETTIKAGIPAIVEGELKISAEFEAGYEWGKSEQVTDEVENTFTVTCKPKHQLTATLLATKGKCDVPFSYTQRDTLIDGTQVIQQLHDGVYTGANSYKFQCETSNEVPLDDETLVGTLAHAAVDTVKAPVNIIRGFI